ncbi:MAG: IPT/TIG domain-containing protein [bacterium]|nr:IPT/TIG domain-containing protein [bacterium]
MRFLSVPVLLLAAIPISFGFLPSLQTSSAPGMRVNRVMVFRAIPYEVRPGDSITIDGSGFSKTLNKVYFNSSYPVISTSTNGTTIVVAIPVSLSEGQYKLSVSNVLGSSDNPNIPVSLKITNSPQSAPVIKNASIAGETITLTGEGFTNSNNIVTTLGNTSTSLSASGDSLTFRLAELSQYEQVKKSFLGRNYKMTLWIFVQNEHGINKDPYKLDIVI